MSYLLSRRIIGPRLLKRVTAMTGIEHIPKTGPALFVSNHVGCHDPLLLGAAIIMHTKGRKVHTLAKWRILKFPLWRHWLGVIPTTPNPKAAFDLAGKHLDDGKFVLIYPENGVNIHPVIGKVKTGAARLALMKKVPFIPVSLKRTSPAPKSSAGYVAEIAYAKLQIHIGAPIDLIRWHDRPIDTPLLREVNHAIMSRIAETAGKHYAPPEA